MVGTIKLHHVKEIIFGAGSLQQLGAVIKRYGASKAFIVIDPYLKESVGAKITASLAEAGVTGKFYTDLTPEPVLEIADACGKAASEFGAEIVIGLGGGSAMDVAKAAAVLVTNGGKAVEYVGVDTVKKPGLPTIMIPSTAGTGSEVSRTAVFINKAKNTKGGMNSDFMYPDVALLDPVLTLTVPPKVTAYTGIDALTHGIESYVAHSANSVSRMYALEAITLISRSIRKAYFVGNDLEARTEMLLGSLLAGISLANAGVGAVHGLSYPLGGEYGVPHGLGNSILLPTVMEFNIPAAMEEFVDIAHALGEDTRLGSTRDAAMASVKAVRNLYQDISMTDKLSDFNIPRAALQKMAEGTLSNMKRVFENNPRPVSLKEAVAIFEAAF
jgi:alcohol dehydrogenase